MHTKSKKTNALKRKLFSNGDDFPSLQKDNVSLTITLFYHYKRYDVITKNSKFKTKTNKHKRHLYADQIKSKQTQATSVHKP